MMATTHALVGVTLAAAFVPLAPESASLLALAGGVGGTAPDVDTVVGTHRKTLHFPALGWVVALPAVAIAVLAPGPATAAAACFLLAAAVHSLSDVLEGGRELRPWERTTDRAVYCHLCRRWLTARRLVRYDGSPEDLLLTAVFAVPPLLAFGGSVGAGCLALVALGAGYTLVRKRVPALVEFANTGR
ncbi:metal-dependent hydrolase [Halomarina litorea]|uniref:metal-dependent hydrolase n=1 Tax=Halomarina litorea TaxID=2961595 RepID=UPI0020C43231|nr:metal-dependent hydrolase [Halomarina sp. BCD28]